MAADAPDGGDFLEHVAALVSEHERLVKANQAMSRELARLRSSVKPAALHVVSQALGSEGVSVVQEDAPDAQPDARLGVHAGPVVSLDDGLPVRVRLVSAGSVAESCDELAVVNPRARQESPLTLPLPQLTREHSEGDEIPSMGSAEEHARASPGRSPRRPHGIGAPTAAVGKPKPEGAGLRLSSFLAPQRGITRSMSQYLGVGNQCDTFEHLFELSDCANAEDVQLFPMWDSEERPKILRHMTGSKSQFFGETAGAHRGGEVIKDESCLQRFVVGPSSNRRILWDATSIFAVGYDVLTVPLIAFDGLMVGDISAALSMCTSIFWVLDIAFSFMTGFYSGGAIEMRPRVIARTYIRSWFFLDLCIILVDWLLILLDSGMADIIGVVRVSKTLRLSRLLRLFRLLRLLKMPAIFDDLASNVHSELVITVISIARSLGLILVVNHFIACGWYALSAYSDPGSPRWVAALVAEDRSVPYRYATSLHWSLTQFTPASMEIHPTNTAERIYAITVLFSALVTFSTFVSSITNAMTGLRRVNSERSQQSGFITRYITENHLSITLGNKINAFVRTQTMRRRRVHESDIGIFRMLPVSLQQQLHWEVYSSKLAVHPLWYHAKEHDPHCLADLCNRAMSEVSLPALAELFAYGLDAEKIYFMQSGVMEYRHSFRDIRVLEKFTAVGPECKRWFCEVGLWVNWKHGGRLVSLWTSEFVALDCESFRKIVAQRPDMLLACRGYAHAFRNRMLDKPADFYWDVYHDVDDIQEMAQLAFEPLAPPENDNGHAGQSFFKRMWRSWSPLDFDRKQAKFGFASRRGNTLKPPSVPAARWLFGDGPPRLPKRVSGGMPPAATAGTARGSLRRALVRLPAIAGLDVQKPPLSGWA
eukprot:CAMPEP_0170224796 /NCGR_PEP_ID=MMETSP0116_2-20130129/12103_1 /TAXON_ID=400756 /ORGANISM="Durinskia baltica, Strain CSIRO CS-38" /LENGTH=877 /DNA_ID=CAMNT_0010475509 /DNA_START=33 /DNA_END=2668 /DNA_ORIENTATION=+